jgi:hypothetical protein
LSPNFKKKKMRKSVLVIIAVLCIGSVFAQSNAPYNVELNIGTRLLQMKNADVNYSCSVADLGAGIGITYMLYNVTDVDFLKSIGFKLDYGYDQATSKILDSDTKTVSTIMRGSGQLVIDVNDLFAMNLSPFGLVLHGGGGASFLNNPASTLPKADMMFNFVAGATPRYWLNDNMAISMDFTLVGLLLQDRGVEMIDRLGADKEFGYYGNVSVGFTYAIDDFRSKVKPKM